MGVWRVIELRSMHYQCNDLFSSSGSQLFYGHIGDFAASIYAVCLKGGDATQAKKIVITR
jgi:hypothetical protein